MTIKDIKENPCCQVDSIIFFDKIKRKGGVVTLCRQVLQKSIM